MEDSESSIFSNVSPNYLDADALLLKLLKNISLRGSPQKASLNPDHLELVKRLKGKTAYMYI